MMKQIIWGYFRERGAGGGGVGCLFRGILTLYHFFFFFFLHLNSLTCVLPHGLPLIPQKQCYFRAIGP